MTSNSEINNKKVELIKGNPKKAIRSIAGPMIITLILCMTYSTVDRIWVAGLGSNELSAVGFLLPIFSIIAAMADGFGAGSNSLIARYIGAEKKHEAINSAWHGIIAGVILSILTPLILLPYLNILLFDMGASTVMAYAKPYITIIILGSFTLIFNGILAGELRAEGDVKRVTLALIATSILNMVLDPLFIYTLNWGIEGAAFATILSAGTATCLMFYWIFIKKDSYITLTRNEFHFNIKIVKQLIAVAIPSTLEEIIIAIVSIIGNLIFVTVATTVVVAGYTAAWSVVLIGIKVTTGIGIAVITVGGTAYGAKNSKKLKTTYSYAIKLSLIFALIIVILIEIFAPQIALLFSSTTLNVQLLSITTETLRVMALFLLTVPIGIISKCIFQGLGKGNISFALTILTEILILVIELILVFKFGLGEYGVYYGLIIGVGLNSIIGFIVFKYYLKNYIEF